MANEEQAVLRYRDGRTERVTLREIDNARGVLTVTRDGSDQPEEVSFTLLKAVFFPRTPASEETPADPGGSMLAVEFTDGEVIRGRASYNPERNGFFLYPGDRTKNDRVFVVNSAIASIEVEKL